MRFRKRPVEIEAMQFDGENGWEIARWAHDGAALEMNSIVQIGPLPLPTTRLNNHDHLHR
jgi:hypothetical protein